MGRADDKKRLAGETRRYLAREADAGRGDLWTVAAAEKPRPRKPRAAKAAPGSASMPATALAEVEAPGLSPAGDTLELIAAEVRACTKCALCETRTQAVPGIGSGRVGVVFVGEAPGAEEDRRGEPFVGRAGDLLTKMIQAMDEKQLIPGVSLARESVFIANVLKCRPPENRNPLPHEIEACSPYLRRQLALLQPKVIFCLGKFAAELLVGAKGTIGGMRGTVFRYGDSKLLVTYHPAACLRNPNYKRPVWEDLQLLAREYQTA
ncbi:MAG: uracil-DNA glycosylase family protein [Candidatus Eisenbacteria bacterium]